MLVRARSSRDQALAKGIAAVLVAAAIVVIFATVTIGANPEPTRGRIPEAAFRPGQPLDLSVVPDFVPALDRDGNVAGWISKELIAPPLRFDEAGLISDLPAPVYADDLNTVVGHMVPGKGFVPVGTNADSVPDFLVSAAPIP